jgi:hypothetical protein
MVTEKYPKVNIVTTWVDECLDEEGVCASHYSALRAVSYPHPYPHPHFVCSSFCRAWATLGTAISARTSALSSKAPLHFRIFMYQICRVRCGFPRPSPTSIVTAR